MKLGKILFIFVWYIIAMNADTPSAVYQYRIFCNTESQNVYQWGTVAPTTCPNNTAHSINPNSISVVDQIASNAVKIQSESVPTGGYFRSETFKVIAAGNTTTASQFVWPFNISLLMVSCTTTSEHEGDSITAEVPSNLTVGAITQDVSIGDTVLNVSLSVINYVAIGFYISITDGTNTDTLNRIISIDKINNKITLETASTHNYSAATPTYVSMTVSPLHDFEFGPPQTYHLGQSSLGASHIPANVPIVVKYTNITADTKMLIFNCEYLY